MIIQPTLRNHIPFALFSAVALIAPSPLRATESDDIKELRTEIQGLEQKLQALEERQARQAQVCAVAAAQASKSAPKITIDDTGFTFASYDGEDFIKLHGLVQLDSRWFFNNNGISNNDGFLIRRARLIFEGGFNRIYSFTLVPEFGGGGTGNSNAPVIYDANLGIALSPNLKLTFGKFKSPIGQEMLQNDAVLLFPERSVATNLVPSRDIGIMAGGSLFGGTLNYALAVLNGGADVTYTSNVALDNNKDVVARLIAKPFANRKDSPLKGLSFGIAGSHGTHNQSAGLTTGYKTDGQQSFFTYASGVAPYGSSWRIAPQGTYYNGPLGVQAEYTRSAVTVLAGSTHRELQNQAWHLGVSYVLTGEKAAYEGVKPGAPFSPTQGTWGAWEVGARVARLKIDSQAFPAFANPAANASGVETFGVGVTWYLSKTVRAMLDYVQDRFDHPGTAATFSNPVIAHDEKAVVTRFQVGF